MDLKIHDYNLDKNIDLNPLNKNSLILFSDQVDVDIRDNSFYAKPELRCYDTLDRDNS